MSNPGKLDPSLEIKLPSPRGVALEIMRACNIEKVATSHIVELLSTDPALTGIILERANVASAGARPVVSISDAVNRLGLNTVKNLSLGFSLIEHYAEGPCAAFDYSGYWSRSVLMAVAMREIGSGLSIAPPEELFVLGLLARVGCLGLATAYPLQYSELLASGAKFDELLVRENAEFAVTHLQLSVDMLGRWGIPDLFASAAQDHEQSPNRNLDILDRGCALQLVLHLSWRIAECIHGAGDERRGLIPEIAVIAASMSFDQVNLEAMIDRIVPQWQLLTKRLHLEGRFVESYADIVKGAESSLSNADGTPLKILVIDDDPITIKFITTWLRRETRHRVYSEEDGEAGQRAAIELKPDVVITDWRMPVMDGIELCKSLRSTDWGRKIYILMLTAADQELSLVKAFEAGVDDYLGKPIRLASFAARLKAAWRFVRLREAWEKDREHLRRLSADLALSNRRLQELAHSDPLTELSNRRAGIETITKLWSAATRHARVFSLISLDIDHFKQINDRYGHLAGDHVLQRIASELKIQARREDTVCRWGGEEFLVVLPDLAELDAYWAAERLRKKIENIVITHEGQTITVTASLGVLAWSSEMVDHDQMLQRLDALLYKAKNSGRNVTTLSVALS